MAVTILVLSGATYSLRLGMEKDSNVVLMASLVTKSTNIALGNRGNLPAILGESTRTDDAVVAEAITNRSQQIINQPSEDKCGKIDFDTASVVNLMNYLGADYSFARRSELAEELLIENYTGTPDQNQELIIWLKSQSGCFSKI